MNVVLTGAAGFLGSHLADTLLENGFRVIGIDDLSTGSLKNIQHLKDNPNFQFNNQDVRTAYDFDCDAILNFACPASPIQYQADPIKTIETNFLGMKNALSLAVRTGAIVIQASTSEIYGDPTITPQKEDYWGNVNPIGIRSCYDEGKRAAETLCYDYMRQENVDVRVARLFNTYGPRMAVEDGRVVSNFIVQALRNENLTIYGDGSQTRSFCYVDDLVRGILKLLQLPTRVGEPTNLGNPNEFTMLELADMVLQESKSNSAIIQLPLPLDDPKQRCPDISKAQELLDWSPTVELKEGIARTVQYFKRVI